MTVQLIQKRQATYEPTPNACLNATGVVTTSIHCEQPKWVIGCQTDPQNQFSYRKTSKISRILVGNKIIDNSDVVGASPVGAAPTTSSFST